MKNTMKKYCIWDKKFDLCKSREGTYLELKKICDELNRQQPNRYEIREVKNERRASL